MNSAIDLEKCLSFINCHLQPAGSQPRVAGTRTYCAVTISREAGSGGHSLAEKLAQVLQKEEAHPGQTWTVFDRNLVERVLQDHNMPARLEKFMPEDHVSEVADMMDELFGLHPASWELVRKTSETILNLAAVGNVILLGRGANVITRRMEHVFHVRLVGSLEKRVKRLQELNHLNYHAALQLAEREDLARQRYLKQFFSKDIKDPLLYDLVINTDRVSLDAAAQMVLLALGGQAVSHLAPDRPRQTRSAPAYEPSHFAN
jgi:cytidylate kinase